MTASGLAPASDAVREFLIECYENLDVPDRDLQRSNKPGGRKSTPQHLADKAHHQGRCGLSFP